MTNINWDNLQPYTGDNKKSLEELCYQIVSEKYKNDISNGAVLTSIDDSGGGDGVEFYLTFENGDIYGWQANFFGRLNEGGRKEQIKKSLQTSYKNHPNIKKWFLYSKLNFTPDEKKWFDESLASSTKNNEKVLPENHSVELIHWGESKLLNYLQTYPSIHKFFFSENILTQGWFKNRYNEDIQKTHIKTKYISDIHIQTKIDNTIHKILCDDKLAETLQEEIEYYQVEMYANEYRNSYLELFSKDVIEEHKEIQKIFKNFLEDKENIVKVAIDKLFEIKNTLVLKDEYLLKSKIKEFKDLINVINNFYKEYDELSESNLCEPIKHIQEIYPDKQSKISEDEYKKIKEESKKREKTRNILFSPLYALSEYAISSLENCLRIFDLLEHNELHISGEAGMGKTHVSFNIYEELVKNQKRPALFILAKDVYTEQDLESQIKSILSIPQDWSFDDFLDALEMSAKVHKTRLPIIIDGLNESIHWNTIWKTGLENLIIKLNKYPHLVLITTYRTSYEDQLFPKEYFAHNEKWKVKKFIRGFENLSWEIINTYFEYYKIKLENHSNAIGYFEHPLHLKIFCETKNPKRENEIKVSFKNEDLFEVFDEYINNCNEKITTLLKNVDPNYDKYYTESKLLELAKYFWEHNVRGISRAEEFFSNNELRIFESENLLVYRDWNYDKNKEEIQFTYDLLGGYFISKYLIKTYNNYYPIVKLSSNNWLIKTIKAISDGYISERATDLVYDGFKKISIHINNSLSKNSSLLKLASSRDFRKKLLETKTEHPLYDDILRTISILLIKKEHIFLFNILRNKRSTKYSIESLFEINLKYIRENEKSIKIFLKKSFENEPIMLLKLAKNIEFDMNHPLNFDFFSEQIKNMSMINRDLFWSEYIRMNHSWHGKSYFTKFVKDFEKACIEKSKLSDKIHLGAKKTMWILTTNIRRLRDEATKALYYYARKFPKEFLDLLEYSLNINDPYVLERMLATSYGLAMARQNNFEDNSYKEKYLPLYGEFLFKNFFSQEAKYTTTHILTRDYAKRTIDIALLHYPSLLNNNEKRLLQYPLKEYPHKEWKELNYHENKYRFGTPIHMDFENYTVGRLVEGRRNYDSEHDEYKKVLSQIYWRMYDLGYLNVKFTEIDKQIANESWNNSYNDNAGKIDRYGKKYSWIAFYEMAGYRSDLSLLKRWENQDVLRISDIDIDPSFPIELKQYNIFEKMKNNNFLGNENLDAKDWYETDNDLEISEYIKITNTFDKEESNEWILLKGDISQKNNESHTRDVNISINAVLIDNESLEEINDIVKNYRDYNFEYMHGNIDNYQINSGEVPWCDLITNNYLEDFQILFNKHKVKKTKKELKIFNNEKELSKEEMRDFNKKKKDYLDESIEALYNDEKNKIPFLISGNESDELTKKLAKNLGYTIKYEDVSYIEEEYCSSNINIETTALNISYNNQSEINAKHKTIVPSRTISNHLELFLKPQTSDLYDKKGNIVSTSFEVGEGYYTSTFTYIRKDYIKQYLKDKNQKLIWIQWTEKRYFPKGIKSYSVHKEQEYRNFYKIIL